MGVAHHAAYPVWLEIARTEVLRQSGVSYRDLEAAGVFLVVARLEMKYRRPLKYDDEIEIRCRLTSGAGGGGVKLEHEYEILRVAPEPSPQPVFVASSVLACVNREGRPQRLPEWLTHGSRASPPEA
jgi:acyl-CoA thioester hydrolase